MERHYFVKYRIVNSKNAANVAGKEFITIVIHKIDNLDAKLIETKLIEKLKEIDDRMIPDSKVYFEEIYTL